MSTNPNDATIAAYEAHVQDYIRTTPAELKPGLKRWIDQALARIPAGSQILEIGSGFGRDADYLESRGFSVIRSDATKSFVAYLREHGHSARVLNVLTEDLGGPYAMIYADAVILHFTPEQAALSFRKARRALRPGSVFAFTAKLGDGDSWSQEKLGAPRYFHYWQATPLRAALKAAGFAAVVISVVAVSGQKWLMVSATA